MSRLVSALAALVVALAPRVSGQDPTPRELLERISRLEGRAEIREARIEELETRLSRYENGELDPVATQLEKSVNALLQEEVRVVDAPDSRMISVGGQLRYRGESRTVKDYAGGVGDETDFVIQRTRVNFDARVVEHVRVFVEIQDARFWGEKSAGAAASSNNSITDLEGVDLHQGYVDFTHVFGRPWTFRVGRQEMSFGDQRLISPLDWSPIGRSFDGVRTWYEVDDFRLDAFAMNVGENSLPTGGQSDDDFVFAGLYGHWTGWENHEVDLYVLYRTFANGSFAAEGGGTGDLEDATVGVRVKGGFDGFSYSAEVVGQFGDRAGDDIEAYAWALVAGYELDVAWKPKLSLEWGFASGDDDPTDGDFETFDPLFAFIHTYQGFLDIFAWRNGHDLVARFSVKPRHDWWAEIAVHGFILDSDRDAWYAATGAPIRRVTAGGVGNEVGLEIDVHFKHDLNEATHLWVGYSHFFAGEYVEDTGRSPDTDWLYFQITLNF